MRDCLQTLYMAFESRYLSQLMRHRKSLETLYDPAHPWRTPPPLWPSNQAAKSRNTPGSCSAEVAVGHALFYPRILWRSGPAPQRDVTLHSFPPCAMNQFRTPKSGAAKTRNSIHSSAVANSKFGNTPWLNIESAGWLIAQLALIRRQPRHGSQGAVEKLRGHQSGRTRPSRLL